MQNRVWCRTVGYLIGAPHTLQNPRTISARALLWQTIIISPFECYAQNRVMVLTFLRLSFRLDLRKRKSSFTLTWLHTRSTRLASIDLQLTAIVRSSTNVFRLPRGTCRNSYTLVHTSLPQEATRTRFNRIQFSTTPLPTPRQQFSAPLVVHGAINRDRRGVSHAKFCRFHGCCRISAKLHARSRLRGYVGHIIKWTEREACFTKHIRTMAPVTRLIKYLLHASYVSNFRGSNILSAWYTSSSQTITVCVCTQNPYIIIAFPVLMTRVVAQG